MRRYPILSRAIQRAINRVGGWVGTRGSSAFLVGGLLNSGKGLAAGQGRCDPLTKERRTCLSYLGKLNLSSRPISKTGFLRRRVSLSCSDNAVTSIGMAMVLSQ